MAPLILYLNHTHTICSPIFQFRSEFQDVFPATSMISCFCIFKLVWEIKSTFEETGIQNSFRIVHFSLSLFFNSCFVIQ